MSDLDELDGYKPTTPFKQGPPSKKRALAQKTTASTNGAGPSGIKPGTAVSGKKRAPPPRPQNTTAAEVLELREEEEEEEEDEIEVAEGIAATAGRGRSKSGPAVMTNGTTKTADKVQRREKEKAPSPHPVSPQRTGSPVVIESSGDEARRRKPATVKKAKHVVSLSPPRPVAAPSERQLARLRKQLDEVTTQRDDLMQQLEQLTELRMTEPEQELEDTVARYEASLKSKDELYQAVNKELERLQPLLKGNRTKPAQFLSREAADEEKRSLMSSLNQANARVSERDARIKELEAELQVVRLERDAEIQRSKDLQAKAARLTPGSASTSLKQIEIDKKDAALVLYQDMAGVMILDVKFEEGENPEKPDTVYHCVSTSNATGLSLSFLLESRQQTEEVNGKKEMTVTDRFSPQNMETESDDFKKRLSYLSGSISFAHDQVDVMYRDLMGFLGAQEDGDTSMVSTGSQ